jgi:hypothetical protein
MNRQYIREHGVMERYLAGVLSAEEEQAFEEAYLEDTELLEELHAAERLREGLRELDTAGRLERSRPRPRWLRAVASPQYAAAASVLLVVTLAFSTVLYRENRELRQQDFAANTAITHLIPLESVRGGATRSTPEPAANEWIVLLVDGGPASYDVYRAAVIRRQDGAAEEVWSGTGLMPTLGGAVAIGLPGRLLRPGDYEVRVEGRMADWPRDRFEQATTLSLTITPRN